MSTTPVSSVTISTDDGHTKTTTNTYTNDTTNWLLGRLNKTAITNEADFANFESGNFTIVPPPAGMEQQKFDELINNIARSYHAPAYNMLFGPNSNSAAAYPFSFSTTPCPFSTATLSRVTRTGMVVRVASCGGMAGQLPPTRPTKPGRKEVAMKNQMNAHLPLMAAADLPGDLREQGASQRGLRRALLKRASQNAAREAIGGLGFGP